MAKNMNGFDPANIKRTVVLLTPLHLLADTRSLKQSASFQRMGFETIVVQDPPLSSQEREMPMEILSLSSGMDTADSAGASGSRGWKAVLHASVKRLSPRWLWEPLSFLWFLYTYLLKIPITGLIRIRRADLIYLHEYRLYPLVRVLSLIHGTPFIYDAHDFYPEVHDKKNLTPFWRAVFMPFLNWLERKCAQRAAAIVTTSHDMAQLIKEHYGLSPIVLRNSHDDRLAIKPGLGLREACGLGEGEFLIAIVGNDKPGQAVEQMLEAMQLLPERVHVAFIGRYREESVNLAEEKGISGRVHFCGRVDAREVVPFVSSADAAALIYFPYTRNYQHFLPNGFFQSVSAELPLLYPSLPEFTRITNEYNLGICIDPLEPASIRDGVLSLINKIDGGDVTPSDLAAAAEMLSWRHEEVVLQDLVNKVLSTEQP